MSMHNSSELANALNANLSQDHCIAFAQSYDSNYTQSFSVAQNLLHQQEYQEQQAQQQNLYSGADSSAQVQYTQPQYFEQQQQDSQAELQNTPALVPDQDQYSSPTHQHAYNGQQIRQSFPVSQHQQLLSQMQPQALQEQRQHLHDQQRYYDASQTQPQLSTNPSEEYTTSISQIHRQYTANSGDAQSGSVSAPTNNSTLSNYPTSTTNYAAPTTTPIVRNIQTTSQYAQYPSPLSAHTTPHVQHHQVSAREAANAQPAAPSSLSVAIPQHGVIQDSYVPPPNVETPATAKPYLSTTQDDSSHEQTPCEFTDMLPTPALESRQKTPAVQPLAHQLSQQQTNNQPHASGVNSADPPHPAPTSQQALVSSQQQNQQPSRAADRMVQALPLFMMETFKVIRKEKDANEEERKRRTEWEDTHEGSQSRLEAELAVQKMKLDALEERLAKKEEEQMKREEELARKVEELAKRDKELTKEKEEVKERMKDVDNKMADMHAMIEAVRIVANNKALPAPTPAPAVTEAVPSVVPAVASSVSIPEVALIDEPASEPSGIPENEQSFAESSSQQQLDSPELFVMSPDLDMDDEEPNPPPVSSITAPKSQECSQPVASTSSSQPLHSSIPAPHMYPFPMLPLHTHNYPPAPGAYHFPTPVPYYPYHHLVPPNYDIPRPGPHTGSTSQFSEFNSHNAAAQYITPNLTPDLAPATVGRVPPPQPPPAQIGATSNQRKRKSKSKYQKKKRRKRRKQATDGNSDEDEGSGSEYASEDEDSSSEESEVEVEPKRRPKRANGHDKKIYTLPHALRVHIYSMMEIISDKELPDSHDESTIYHPSQPVRFVWEKTCKQSVHNARMKLLVLEDIKEKRASMYSKVPVEDFNNKAVMEKKFDNVFETMRGKYKAQRSEELAKKEREREAKKAKNSRHLARKTAKLSDRSETRLKMPKYEPVVFDPALLRECMSSDESDVETDPATQVKVDIYRSRGPAWRSGRLNKFYTVLEDNKVVDPNVRPKGGVGKKRPRRTGPPKDEFMLPPKGIAPWMVSRRWVQKAKKTHVDLESVLGRLVADEYALDGDMYEELGDESEVDEDGDLETGINSPPAQDQQEVPIQGGQMRTLRLGLQPQGLEVGPAFSGRYTLQ